jgi:hypothetical protein
VCSGEEIRTILEQFTAYLVTANLEQAASDMTDGVGAPGQFFRVARHTIVASACADDYTAGVPDDVETQVPRSKVG